ncbi:hypothetical protein F2Q69_00019590 [Brassica cretica]|uniref:Uncharacterized protein n=1 Tax=Brassica cretica TaxID=69181 RepID=A0A8S9PZG4_BRACR|nr:hypothetical protein F2Q69_00019590 [Brassica cretica]
MLLYPKKSGSVVHLSGLLTFLQKEGPSGGEWLMGGIAVLDNLRRRGVKMETHVRCVKNIRKR